MQPNDSFNPLGCILVSFFVYSPAMLSLWLLPKRADLARLHPALADLGTSQAHVPILSGICESLATAISKTEQLAKFFKTFEAGLSPVGYLEGVYKCLFFRTDQSEQIFALRSQAQTLFEHTQVEPFIPQLSFLYGRIPFPVLDSELAESADICLLGFDTLVLVSHQPVLEQVWAGGLK